MTSVFGFRDAILIVYDNLGGVVSVNLLWVVCALPWLFIAVVITTYGNGIQGQWASYVGVIAFLLAVQFLWFGPPTVLLFLASKRWLAGHPAYLSSLIRELPKFAIRVQLVGFSLMAVTCVVIVNIFFYQRMGGSLGAILSGFMGWILLGLGLMSLYLLPTLIGEDLTIFAACRRSAILVFTNLLRSVVLLIIVVTLLVLGVVTGIGFLCGVLSLIAFTETIWVRVGTRALSRPIAESLTKPS